MKYKFNQMNYFIWAN